MSDATRLNGVQPVEGVVGGTSLGVTSAGEAATGGAVPTDATYIGGANGSGKLTGASVGTKGGIVVEGAAGATAIPVSGTVTATSAAEGGTGGALPASATYIGGANGSSKLTGASIGTKGGLVVEGASGGAAIPVSGSPTDGTHTAAVKAGSAAPVAADEALVVAINPTTPALKTAVHNTTTPSLSATNENKLEVDACGNVHVNACSRHWRTIALPSGLAASAASLAEGACDAMQVDTDNVVVYAQPPERPLIASQTGGDWTGAAGWSVLGNVWTHAAAGGTGDLEITPAGISGINVGDTFCVIYTVTINAGTSVTAKLGTGAGTPRTISGTYVELITSAGTAKVIFTPTNDLDASIDMATVFVIPATPKLLSTLATPMSAVKVVAIAAAATPATPHATAKVCGLWLRRKGAVEVT